MKWDSARSYNSSVSGMVKDERNKFSFASYNSMVSDKKILSGSSHKSNSLLRKIFMLIFR